AAVQGENAVLRHIDAAARIAGAVVADVAVCNAYAGAAVDAQPAAEIGAAIGDGQSVKRRVARLGGEYAAGIVAVDGDVGRAIAVDVAIDGDVAAGHELTQAQ